MLTLTNAAAWSRLVEPAFTSGGCRSRFESEPGEEKASSKPLSNAASVCPNFIRRANGGGSPDELRGRSRLAP